MLLFDPFNFFLLLGVVIGVCTLIGLGVGLYMWTGTRDWIEFIWPTVLGSIVGGVLTLLIGGGVYDSRTSDIQSAFESTYQVSIVEGAVPTGPNDTSNLLLFTQTGGPVACIVFTDDTKYSLICDGKELRPVN